MRNSLDPKVQEKLEALCNKVSVAHDLDPEIREELQGHMEDKLLAYLNGEETVTEEDAFILVREHFGDPGVVKGLMQEVHSVESGVSLARRLAAAFCVTNALALGFRLVGWLALALVGPASPIVERVFLLAGITLFFVSFPLVPWLVLRKWQRQIDARKSPWFMTLSPFHLSGITLLFFLLPVLHMIVPMLALDNGVQGWLGAAALILCVSSVVLNCTVWLWWCDQKPRTGRNVGQAAGAWVLMLLLSTLFDLGPLSITVDAVYRVLPSFVVYTVMALVACALYSIIKRFHGRKERIHLQGDLPCMKN